MKMELTQRQRRYRNDPGVNEKSKRLQREYAAKLRASVLLLLGGKCIKCGFDDPRALQIDHIEGNGNEDRKSVKGMSFHKKVLEEISKGNKKYQLLCANCNWIKRAENKELYRYFRY
jgi:hypothetical protein